MRGAIHDIIGPPGEKKYFCVFLKVKVTSVK